MTTPQAEQKARELIEWAFSWKPCSNYGCSWPNHIESCAVAKQTKVLQELTLLIQKSDALDWLEKNWPNMIVDTDTLIPPKWFITMDESIKVRRADTLLSAINQARREQ